MKFLKKIGEVKEGLAVAATVSFMLCIYAPIELFLSSQDDFWFTLGRLGGVAALMFAAVFVLLAGGLIILRLIGKIPYYIGLLIGTAGMLICYVQGNFLVKGVPALDGTNVNWNAPSVERIKSIALCLLSLAALLCVLLKFKAVIFKKTVLYSSVALGVLLAITLTTLCITTPVVEKKGDLVATGYNDLTYSEDKNLIILIVDATDATRFEQALESNPEFDSVFNDFTYYDDALAMYPYTLNAVPSMLTGVWNKNEMSYRKYVEYAFEKSPLISYLREENYRIGLYNKSEIKLSQNLEGVFENMVNTEVKFSNPIAAATAIAKMSSIRYAPWDLKRFGYNLTQHLDDSRYSSASDTVKKNNKVFYDAVRKTDGLSSTADKCARIIHIEGSHVPYQYDKNVNVIEDATYMDNVECTITVCSEYLESLKKNGTYDNSVIVILGDHGFDDTKSHGLEARAHPMLLVKGINDKGNKMTVNSTPVSYESFAEACTALLKGEVTKDTMFDKYEYPEGRIFIQYGYLSEDHMTEYVFKGRADELDKVEATGNVYDLK